MKETSLNKDVQLRCIGVAGVGWGEAGGEEGSC